MEEIEPVKSKASEARIQMRLQMRRDRQVPQAKLAAAKKKPKEEEEGAG